jgi:hypothetical protein
MHVLGKGYYTVAVYWRQPVGRDFRPRCDAAVLKNCLAALFPIVCGMFPLHKTRPFEELYRWARRNFYKAMVGPNIGPVQMPHFSEGHSDFGKTTIPAFQRLVIEEAGAVYSNAYQTLQAEAGVNRFDLGPGRDARNQYVLEVADLTDLRNAELAATRSTERRKWTVHGMLLMRDSVQSSFDKAGGSMMFDLFSSTTQYGNFLDTELELKPGNSRRTVRQAAYRVSHPRHASVAKANASHQALRERLGVSAEEAELQSTTDGVIGVVPIFEEMLGVQMLDDDAAERLNLDITAANADATGLIHGGPYPVFKVKYGDGMPMSNAEMGNEGGWLVDPARAIWPSGESPELQGKKWKGPEKEHLQMLEAEMRESGRKTIKFIPYKTRLELDVLWHAIVAGGDHKYMGLLALRVGSGGLFRNHMGRPTPTSWLKRLALLELWDFHETMLCRLRYLVELSDSLGDLLQQPGKLLLLAGVQKELKDLGLGHKGKKKDLEIVLANAIRAQGPPSDDDIQQALASHRISAAKLDAENARLRKAIGIIGFPVGCANSPQAAAEMFIALASIINPEGALGPVTAETGSQMAFLTELDRITSPHPLTLRAGLHHDHAGRSNLDEWRAWMADPSILVDNTPDGPRPKPGLEGQSLKAKRTSGADDHSMKHRNKRLMVSLLHNRDARLCALPAALKAFTERSKKVMNLTSFLSHAYGWKYLKWLYDVTIFKGMPQPLCMLVESVALSNYMRTRKARALVDGVAPPTLEELQKMSLADLRQYAVKVAVDPVELDEARDAEDAKAAIGKLVVKTLVAGLVARPEHSCRITIDADGVVTGICAAEVFADDACHQAVMFANEWMIFEGFDFLAKPTNRDSLYFHSLLVSAFVQALLPRGQSLSQVSDWKGERWRKRRWLC